MPARKGRSAGRGLWDAGWVPSDFIIKTGDMIQIKIPQPTIVPAIQAPVPLKGSSTDTQVNNQFVCLQGDELPSILQGALPYTSPPFVTPGTGTLTLTLLPANLTVQSQNGKKILIKGQMFTA